MQAMSYFFCANHYIPHPLLMIYEKTYIFISSFLFTQTQCKITHEFTIHTRLFIDSKNELIKDTRPSHCSFKVQTISNLFFRRKIIKWIKKLSLNKITHQFAIYARPFMGSKSELKDIQLNHCSFKVLNYFERSSSGLKN